MSNRLMVLIIRKESFPETATEVTEQKLFVECSTFNLTLMKNKVEMRRNNGPEINSKDLVNF